VHFRALVTLFYDLFLLEDAMKKKILITLVLLLLTSIFSPILFSQWIRTPGPEGCRALTCTISGNNFLLGTSTGDIYYSSDHGGNWALSASGIPFDASINSFSLSDGLVYAATSHGVFYSSDNGITWLTNDANWEMNIFSLVHSGSVLFAGFSDGVYKSTDNGYNWYLSINGLPVNPNVQAMVVKSSYIFATAGNGIYVSTNMGSNWSSSSLGLPQTGMNSIISCNNRLFTSCFLGVYSSTDNGFHWDSCGTIPSIAFPSITSMCADSNEIIIATSYNGVFKSIDYGANWISCSNGIPSSGNQYALLNCIYANNNYCITAMNHAGAMVSSNSGGNWIFSARGTSGSEVEKLFSDGGNLYAGTFFNGISLTTDMGVSWNNLNSEFQLFGVEQIFHFGQNILVGAQGQPYSGIFLSSNGGANWILVQSDSIWDRQLKGFASIGNTIFAANEDSLLRSNNMGFNWTSCGPSNFYSYSGIYSHGSDLYVIANDSLFRSSNSGLNWVKIFSGAEYPTCISIRGNAIFVGTEGYGIYRSVDNGTSWSNIGLRDGYTIITICISDTNVFAIDGTTTYYSANFGDSWFPVDLPHPYASFLWDIAVQNGYLFAASENYGVWKRPLSSIIGIKSISSSNPKFFRLHQNYPNPFNPSTKIRFDIPASVNDKGITKLTIFDILGRQVTTLLNQRLTPGSYEVDWHAENFASGIYFYRLETGNYVDVKKMILLK